MDVAEGRFHIAAHVLGLVELGFLGQMPTLIPGWGWASLSISVSIPAMMRRRLDLPAPLSPSTLILVPGKKTGRCRAG